MKIQIINNKKHSNGVEEKEIQLRDIVYLSDLKSNRYIAVEDKAYRLTAKSYTEVRKKLGKCNLIYC